MLQFLGIQGHVISRKIILRLEVGLWIRSRRQILSSLPTEAIMATQVIWAILEKLAIFEVSEIGGIGIGSSTVLGSFPS